MSKRTVAMWLALYATGKSPAWIFPTWIAPYALNVAMYLHNKEEQSISVLLVAIWQAVDRRICRFSMLLGVA